MGELHIKPAKEEFFVKNAKPRFGVKVKNIHMLPDCVFHGRWEKEANSSSVRLSWVGYLMPSLWKSGSSAKRL